nr:reverse transcriptase domain-containing protein [Tanacetum cinerariifolium]
EVLGSSDVITSGNLTSFYDPIVSTTFSTLTPFENSDFLFEEVDAFLGIEDDPTSLEFYQPYLDPEEDILLLEAFLNDDPSLPPLNQGNYMPEVRSFHFSADFVVVDFNADPRVPLILRRSFLKTERALIDVFKEMSFEISFTDTLMLMPKFASTLKALIRNKEKLSEMARTLMNEHCLAVILNKLPKKLGDPGKFLIPCEFPRMDECLALVDLGASNNLMPIFVWKGLTLPELTSTYMTLELADRTESKPVVIAKDVKVKVGMFHFPVDFMVVDFEPHPRVPLILGRCFLKISRALIEVYKGELTLRIGNESITYILDQTSRFSANYDQMTANKIDVTDEACDEYSQEVLGFSDVTESGSPTPSNDPIVSTTSPALTLFGDSDFLLFEEADAFLGLEDDPDSPELDPSYYDPEGDILSLEVILNSDPSPPLLNHEQSVPSFKEELKACEAKTIKSSIDEPPEVELKDLPPILNMHFWKATTSYLSLLLKH